MYEFVFFDAIIIKAGTYVVTNFRSYASFSELHRYPIFWNLAVICFWIFFGRFLWFGPNVSIVVSWCLVPCTLLIYDLIWLLIMFRSLLGACLLLKSVWICFFFDAIIIKAGTYVVTNFPSYASFSELHCYPIFWNLAVICFWIIFGRFLWFGPIVSIVVSCCLMSCTFLINDLVLFCCLEAADS